MGWGEGLSPAVKEALPEVVAAVIQDVQRICGRYYEETTS